MPRGGVRPGAGRKKGGTNAATRATREIALRAAAEGITPLQYMLDVLRDPESPEERRAWAAEKAAPYIHPRLEAIAFKEIDKKQQQELNPKEVVKWLAFELRRHQPLSSFAVLPEHL